MKLLKKILVTLAAGILILYGTSIVLKQAFGIVIPFMGLFIKLFGGFLLIYAGFVLMTRLFENKKENQ